MAIQVELGESSRGDDEFSILWTMVFPQLRSYARYAMRNDADAHDLCQLVALRVWRGLPGYRGEASPAGWVMAIAAREAARLSARRLRLATAEAPLGAEQENITDPSPGPEETAIAPRRDLMVRALAQAHASGHLGTTEYQVLNARLTAEDGGWNEVGATLGLAAGTCAVAYSRAVAKLRVFLFLHRPDVLGGTATVTGAFTAAAGELTPAEASMFRLVVLERRDDGRPRNWPTVLRAACAKVARRLPE